MGRIGNLSSRCLVVNIRNAQERIIVSCRFSVVASQLFCLSIAFLAGCGPSEYAATIEPTVPAAGVIRYQGKPLDFYRVSFIPESKRPASGMTDKEGRFTLGTNAEGDGAAVGKHIVTVDYVGPPSNEEPGKETFAPPPASAVSVPAKFSSAETSGVSLDILATGNVHLEINLEEFK